MKKLGYIASIAVTAACSLAAAQDLKKRRPRRSFQVEDGGRIKVTGCVERNADGAYTC